MFDEIDYIREAKNAERFASLYSFDSGRFSCYKLCSLFGNIIADTIYLPLLAGNDQMNDNAGPRNKSRNHRAENIKVPKIYWNFTRTAVLTMEWIDGIKLTDEIKLRRASLDRRDLIDQVTKQRIPNYARLMSSQSDGLINVIPRHSHIGVGLVWLGSCKCSTEKLELVWFTGLILFVKAAS